GQSGALGLGGFGGRGGAMPAGKGMPKADNKAEAESLKKSVVANDPNAIHAKDTAAELARRIGTGTVGNAATAGALGDFFQYVIDHPVTLSRQKSALLPIVGKDVEGAR